ncbi:hypothetical protein B0T17DRAFT_507355 [Bombardia bombarda]|uniref:Uncharacterized protein n=1 Tax=Bombardia bombarda TaxID=252184 RepID=A0AA40CAA3_9PEZI|nr:hypothetical protein B0T17DRAFT_507355 [Bombardia bombarda]
MARMTQCLPANLPFRTEGKKGSIFITACFALEGHVAAKAAPRQDLCCLDLLPSAVSKMQRNLFRANKHTCNIIIIIIIIILPGSRPPVVALLRPGHGFFMMDETALLHVNSEKPKRKSSVLPAVFRECDCSARRVLLKVPTNAGLPQSRGLAYDARGGIG